VDEAAVIDGNLVSARVPKDLPAFARAMLTVLGQT
jgi:putative intracellular protease/amidase